MPAATVEVPAVALSFANNFWGKEDAGVGPLLDRMHAAKLTSDELRSFYSARASIEDEYARKLLSLCRKSLGSQETGSLKSSLDVLRGEVESMARQHQSNAAQMKTELEEPLSAFAGAMKERRKIVQNGIEKLLKVKVQQTQHLNKTRDKYEQECLKIKGYLAQGHMVMGQEERKNKAKLEKTQISLATSNTDYENAVKALEDTTARWNREWKAAADKFQDLEEERLDFTKNSLWTFANIASTVCVSDDASCEKIRLALEKMDVEKDIVTFIRDKGTGQEIPDPPKYINFCRGDINDSTSEVSDDENYSVAQFQRNINPAFRTSSPQPSTYESHHDPNSTLALNLGHGASPSPGRRETSLTPQKAPVQVERQALPVMDRQEWQQPLALDRQQTMPVERQQTMPVERQQPMPVERQQSMPVERQQQWAVDNRQMRPAGRQQPVAVDRQQAMLMDRQPPHLSLDRQGPITIDKQYMTQSQMPLDVSQHGPFAAVPHDPYPLDGMTMLCRTGPASDLSSQPASARPSSRDSRSEYSNPTSFSSQEPPSGKTSPIKQQESEPVPSPEKEKRVLKKRSGFFQNHSPFRRKSTKDMQGSPAGANRNTWHASSKKNDQESPSRRPQLFSRDPTNVLAARAPSPDPIDANASVALGIGPNVLPVTTSELSRASARQAQASQPDESDPIAMALAELKVDPLSKQSSVRVSADYYHGISTPVPGSRSRMGSNSAVAAGMRGTPPPSYDHQVQRLGVPPSAHTAKAMKETSEKFVGQTRNMFNSSASSYGTPGSRPGTRGNDMPRAASPAPLRSTSPLPNSAGYRRSASPNPRAGHNRTTSQMSSNQKRGSDQGYYRHQSPYDMARSASPAPSSFKDYGRPNSSHVSNDMAVQLAPVPDDGYGSMRGRGQDRPGTSASNRGAMGLYDGGGTRQRSKSVADPSRQYTRDGRPILHFARALYMYQAAIPEELGFAKGDTMAVLRHQDDGWWEAEVHGSNGRAGLVPSNYLQPI